MAPIFTIYLLRFEHLVNGKRYYVGRCKTGRLENRMREHQAGRGSNLTRQACETGTAWNLVHAWEGQEPEHEKKVQAMVDRLAGTRDDVIGTSGKRFAPTKTAQGKGPEPLNTTSTQALSTAGNAKQRAMKKAGRGT